MTRESLSILGEKVEAEENPKELLKEIFRFINFEPANIDIYFLFVEKKRALTVREICNSLKYSERTVRKYLKELLALGYIKRVSTVRERPCYAYVAVKTKKVWQKLVNQVRQIRKKASKRIAKI